MATKVLDLTTIGHALNELQDTHLGDCRWMGDSGDQQTFLAWYDEHRDEIAELDSLEALASTDYAELNAFLRERNFDEKFDPFDGVGVASVIDMLVEWVLEGELTTIDGFNRAAGTFESFPAFSIEPDNVDVFDAAGFEQPLVRFHTKTGHSMWLMQAPEPSSGLSLNRAGRVLLNQTELRVSKDWTAGVTMPMLEMDQEADLAWMLGITAISPTLGRFILAQAFQQFKLRANQIGARIKVATGLAFESLSVDPEPYVFNQPFIGFFTQPGHDTLPLTAFWADTDVWKNPGGTLEEL